MHDGEDGVLEQSTADLLREMDATVAGLTTEEARERLARFGENRLKTESRSSALGLFLAQFKSPIILILIGAACVSLFLQAHTDADHRCDRSRLHRHG